MTDEKVEQEQDLELEAMGKVYAALKPLESDAQARVLEYVERRLALVRTPVKPTREAQIQEPVRVREPEPQPNPEPEEELDEAADGLEGISPLAQKWMKRNGLTSEQVSNLFSLGVDEIDLVAKSVPGDTTKDKLKSVLLLQGVASHLSGGAPRITHEKLKQAVSDYNADAGKNFQKYLRSFAAEVSATDSGYQLTTKGLNAAKELIVEMTTPKK